MVRHPEFLDMTGGGLRAVRLAAGNIGAHPLQRPLQPVGLNRLHQIVDRRHVECRDREIVEGGDENHGRVHRRGGQGPGDIDPVHAGHGDVEQDKIGRYCLGDAQGRLAIIGGADHGDALQPGEQQLQPLDRQRLVIDDHDAQGTIVSHVSRPACRDERYSRPRGPARACSRRGCRSGRSAGRRHS